MSSEIIGHDKELALLHAQVAQNTLHHAVLLYGPQGIGKRLIAKNIAQHIFCNATDKHGACNTCPACSLFLSENCPDFHLIDCTDKEMASTAGVRELLYSLHLKTYGNQNRVVVFCDAEHLRPQAANALLKSLEEPREGTYFLLTTSNRSQLLPTILSRCQCWGLKELSTENIMAIARDKLPEIDAEVLKSIALLADGSVENIDHLEQHLSEWKNISSSIRHICQGNILSALEMIENLPREKEELAGVLQLMRMSARAEMKKNPSARIAYLLSELTLADYYIFSRNLSPAYLLGHIFTNVARGDTRAPSIAEIAA